MSVESASYTRSRVDALVAAIEQEMPSVAGRVLGYHVLPEDVRVFPSVHVSVNAVDPVVESNDMIHPEWTASIWFYENGKTDRDADERIQARGDQFIKFFSMNAKGDSGGLRSGRYLVLEPHWYLSKMGKIEYGRNRRLKTARVGVFDFVFKARLLP